ncbi:MAG: hypothetical protein GY811_13490 [Myxococcales bacterium]|nr:hypothetical protein [Myxococcales bacterium]
MQASLRVALGGGCLLAASLAVQGVGSAARDARSDWPIEEYYVTLPPTEAARFSYLGYNELAADVTWSRLLVYYGSGFLGEGDFRYLGNFIDNVIALDPEFKKVYEWAMYSVTVNEEHRVSTAAEDIRKSIDILEKAMVAFPDEYEFFWLAGVRYYLDMKSDDKDEQRRFKEHGAELMERAMSRPGAPKDLANKAAAFRSLLGQHEHALATLKHMYMTTDDEKARASMLRNFRYVAGDDIAEELKRAANLFSELRLEHGQQFPEDLFVILGGPAPSPVIDFDKLATKRDLFGATEEASIELFPH